MTHFAELSDALFAATRKLTLESLTAHARRDRRFIASMLKSCEKLSKDKLHDRPTFSTPEFVAGDLAKVASWNLRGRKDDVARISELFLSFPRGYDAAKVMTLGILYGAKDYVLANDIERVFNIDAVSDALGPSELEYGARQQRPLRDLYAMHPYFSSNFVVFPTPTLPAGLSQ